MGGFHRRVLRDLGMDVSTVDPDPAAGADYVCIPARAFDVVCVACPIKHLAEQAALWAGHDGWLLIEKPMAPSADEAHELATLFAGQRVAVGYVERFNPIVREALRHPTTRAHFVRWNDRPSSDVALDLLAHDVDLAHFAGLADVATFDARPDCRVKRREIQLDFGTFHLMSHDTSPLHAQWHAFLSERGGYATPADAAVVLDSLVTAGVYA